MPSLKRARAGIFVARWWPALGWLAAGGLTQIALKAVGQ